MPALQAGQKVVFYSWPDPRSLGFHRLAIAEQVGQIADWALPLADGSRLHLWQMPDGRWILHRDAIDPGRGPLQAAAHVATETRVGAAVIAAATVVGAVAFVSWVAKG